MNRPDRSRHWQVILSERTYRLALGISVLLAALLVLTMLAWVLSLIL